MGPGYARTGLHAPDGNLSRLSSPPIGTADVRGFTYPPPLDYSDDTTSSNVELPPTIADLRRELFEAIVADLKALNDAVPWDRIRGNLRDKHGKRIHQCKTTADPRDMSPTILHWIAHKIRFDALQETDARFQAAELLADIAVELDPSMLSKPDRESGSTPLHLLHHHTEPGVSRIITAMCRAAQRHSEEGARHVPAAIALQDKAGNNVLHLAIHAQLPDAKDLIALTSSDAVVAQRAGDGNTPLHHAVDPELCAFTVQECGRKGRANPMCDECASATKVMERKRAWVLQIVAALVGTNGTALAVRNRDGLPPLLSSKLQLPSKMADGVARSPDRAGSGSQGSLGTSGTSASTAGNASHAKTSSFSSYFRTNQRAVSANNSPPRQGALPSHARSESGQRCHARLAGDLAKDIERYIVESAFDLDGFELVSGCFFADNADKETIFRPDRPLSLITDAESFSFLNFGETLAQVKLSIDPADSKYYAGGLDSSLIKAFQAALLGIFEMLSRKGVRRILKLTVRDNPKTPCSDELIRRCLRNLDVRYLDWSKPDLGIDVVMASAPRVAELWLHSSGNTAVLRRWAGSQGLCNLNHLRMVHLHGQPGLEWTPHLGQALGVFETDAKATVKLNRRIEIVSMEAAQQQQEMVQLETKCGSLNQYLEREKMNRKTSSQAKPEKTSHVLKQLETCRTRLNELRPSYEKLTALKRSYLQAKEGHAKSSARTPSLSDAGVHLSPHLRARIDFVALVFEVNLRIAQPVRNGRIKLKAVVQDDETRPVAPRNTKPHRWLNSLSSFVGKHVQSSDRGARVRVAIIDDGVDAHLDEFRGKIKAGWPCEKASSSSTPFYQSTKGHGTVMARLVATACPHVDLYVAKLKLLNGGVDPDEFWKEGYDAETASIAHEAALAIDWARKQKVHVICMSWTMVATEDNTAEVQRLSQTIRDAAVKDNIIMYCATSDQGMYGSMKALYPAGAGTAHVKSVGSATENGHSSDFVNPHLVNYLFPGEGFEEIGDDKGSSVATALAVGFAALILWCYDVSRPRSRARMGTPQAMNWLFEGLQSLVAASRHEGMPTKWVDASILLGLGGIEAVVAFTEGEVQRRALVAAADADRERWMGPK